MRWKVIAYLFLGVLVAAQFIRPTLGNQAPVTQDEFGQLFHPPAEIKHMLKRACYDCHSNHTNYPWYAHIQPMGSYLDKHIADGKAELNFDEFTQYKGKRRFSKLMAVKESVISGDMPLRSYQLLHPESKFSDQEKATLLHWIQQVGKKGKP